LLGLSRSGETKVSSLNDPSLGAKARELVGLAPSALAESVLAKFISSYSHQLKKFSIPWFIPESLGGLGLPSVGRFGPDVKFLKLAAKIHSHPDKYKLPSLPRSVPWQTWILAKKLFPLPPPESLLPAFLENPGNLSYNDFWSKASVALLFRSDMTLAKLMTGATKNAQKREQTLSDSAHRKLSRLWGLALRDKLDPFYRYKPLDPLHYPHTPSLNDLPLLFKEKQPVWARYLDLHTLS